MMSIKVRGGGADADRTNCAPPVLASNSVPFLAGATKSCCQRWPPGSSVVRRSYGDDMRMPSCGPKCQIPEQEWHFGPHNASQDGSRGGLSFRRWGFRPDPRDANLPDRLPQDGQQLNS